MICPCLERGVSALNDFGKKRFLTFSKLPKSSISLIYFPVNYLMYFPLSSNIVRAGIYAALASRLDVISQSTQFPPKSLLIIQKTCRYFFEAY